MKVIKLREGKERSLLRRHPWVFEGSIATGKAGPAPGRAQAGRTPSGGGEGPQDRRQGAPGFGETVRVESASGDFLCWAAYSPSSSIKLRAWSFLESERIDAAFFERRIAAALAYRARLAIDSNGQRLIHGEADGLPGLIVDRYADTLVAQFLAAGTEQWKGVIADALLAATGLTRLYERSDSGVRQLEGLQPVKGWVRGEGGTEVELHESSWKLTLDVAEGHKTGYYLDQRDNRREFARWVRQLGAQRVLNCYSYTGGFSVAALAGGATEVTSVDSSAPALARATAHVTLNGFNPAHHTALDADVNATLRGFLKEGRQFDAIVLDPPKFAPSAAHAERASRAYKDINRLGLKLLAPGGLLCTYSCSGGVGPELFHKIVAGAGMDAGVDAYIVDRVGAAPDHPQTLVFPEGEYLKGLLVMRRG